MIWKVQICGFFVLDFQAWCSLIEMIHQQRIFFFKFYKQSCSYSKKFGKVMVECKLMEGH